MATSQPQPRGLQLYKPYMTSCVKQTAADLVVIVVVLVVCIERLYLGLF